MTSTLSNIIKSHAASLDQSAGQVKFGTVTSVNANNATARVLIQPEGVLSGWLPVLSQWVGNGWGVACPPSPATRSVSSLRRAMSSKELLSAEFFPSIKCHPLRQCGEFWLVHQSGSSLKLCNDGTIRDQRRPSR